ncbi:hypothetical protein [Paenibacillus sp. 481]|uniref:hypothetical protein n=1 Tax=Paenibacillus sp. 481 TaxID=2835869 RepID=UPI001E2A90D7|nr:hypothetical protein [Paenibacillus sp. 481]UHA73444.1 hypothetical protein KIK04_23270 [Paenibacillus sp. 481]
MNNAKHVKSGSVMILFLCSVFIFMVGCTTNEAKLIFPKGIPQFVKESDFAAIDWEKRAVPFGDQGIIGNERKAGVIGANMPSLSEQKWMWHLWGVSKPESTIVGYHKETTTVHQILALGDNWTS